ncbi:MAG: amino acid permease [Gemmatimonadaceae bacterium]
MEGESRRAPPLARVIGPFSATAIVVGSMIGSGIFRSPAVVADRVGDPMVMLGVWIIGGVLALSGALSLAEVGSALPRTGGLFAFLKEAWGPLPAFLFGWSELVIIRGVSFAAVSITFAEYAYRVLGLDPANPSTRVVAALAMAIVAVVNIIGVRQSTQLVNATAIARAGGLLLLTVLALSIGLPRTGGHYTTTTSAPVQWSAVGFALVGVLWSYDGWGDLSRVGGEVRDPARTFPRAVIAGTLIVTALYVGANVGYLAVLPIGTIRESPLVAADVAERLVGSLGRTAIGIIVVISALGSLHTACLTAPRIFFAMADDGLFFRFVARVHPRYQTPYVAILLGVGLGIVLVLSRSFAQLADSYVTAMVPFYALGVGSIFVLRRRDSYRPSFRTPGYPLVPIVFLATCGWLLLNSLSNPDSRVGAAVVLGMVVAGVPVYWLAFKRRRA